MSHVVGEADLITTQERRGSSQRPVITTNQRGGERVHIDPKLHQAASGGNLALLERLVGSEGENHAQPDETAIDVANLASPEHRTDNLLVGVTHSGDTALHISACFGQYEVAEWICNKNRLLLMQGNDKAETPLHYAAQAGNCRLVMLFIQFAEKEGGNVVAELLRKRNQDGETALYQAINHCQVLEVDHCSFGSFRPLHFHIGKAIQALEEENTHVAVVKELLRADLAVANCPSNQTMSQLASIPNNSAISPLYLAIMKNSLSIVTSLVGSLPKSSSRAEYSGPAGRTALHAAAVRNEGSNN